MQKYWMLYEYMDSAAEYKGPIRGYGLVRDGKDAVRRAKQNLASLKTASLLRVWVTNLEAEKPVHTLVFGDVPVQGKEMELDNPTKQMVKTYNSGNGSKKARKNKPRVRVPAQPVDTTPAWRPYIIITSDSYLKQQENANGG